MSKHTPSPWSFALDSEEGLYRLTAGKELIAKAVGQNQETDEANARLIAAAPELFELLGAVLNNRRLLNDEHFSGVSERLFSKIKDALKKAEGRE